MEERKTQHINAQSTCDETTGDAWSKWRGAPGSSCGGCKLQSVVPRQCSGEAQPAEKNEQDEVETTVEQLKVEEQVVGEIACEEGAEGPLSDGNPGPVLALPPPTLPRKKRKKKQGNCILPEIHHVAHEVGPLDPDDIAAGEPSSLSQRGRVFHFWLLQTPHDVGHEPPRAVRAWIIWGRGLIDVVPTLLPYTAIPAAELLTAIGTVLAEAEAQGAPQNVYDKQWQYVAVLAQKVAILLRKSKTP